MIKQRPWHRWSAWGIAALFYAYQYVLRVAPQVFMPELLTKYSVGPEMLGSFQGVYYLGYALAHIPLGLTLDRVGVKYVLPLCVVATVVGIYPLAFMDSWMAAMVGRFLIGVGSSGAILSLFQVAHIYFPPTAFSRVIGGAMFIGLSGALLGGRPLQLLLDLFQWTGALVFLGIVGVGLAIGSFLLLPRRHYPVLEEESRSFSSIFRDLRTVLSHRYVLMLCILGGLMVGPVEGFADLWGAAFLKAVYHLPEALAMTLPGLIFAGFAIGGPTLTWVADKTQAYRALLVISAFTMGGLFTLMLWFTLPEALLQPLLLIVGIFSSYQIFIMYKASRALPTRLLGVATASANMIMMAFGDLFHKAIGRLVAGEDCIDHTQAFTSEALTRGISIIPICLLIAGVGLIFLFTYHKKHKVAPPLQAH